MTFLKSKLVMLASMWAVERRMGRYSWRQRLEARRRPGREVGSTREEEDDVLEVLLLLQFSTIRSVALWAESS
jgi:hypothetical protein